MHTVRTVKRPSEEFVESMTDLLHESFGNHYFGAALGTTELSRYLLKHHIKAALVDPAGEVWVAEDSSEEGKLVGVAVWFGPGGMYLATSVHDLRHLLRLMREYRPEQRSVGWDQLYGKLDTVKQQWWDYVSVKERPLLLVTDVLKFLSVYDGLSATTLGEGVKLGGYHLQVIGVRASYQRQGIAKSLFKVVEEKAKEQAVCTCLETVGNFAVPVYTALGYDVKGPVPLRSVTDPNASMPLYAFIKVFN